MLGGLWHTKTFTRAVVGSRGGGELHNAVVQLSFRMKGGTATKPPSNTDPATTASLEKPTSMHGGCLYFKVIFQLDTTVMEITYRQKNKRTNGFLVPACIIMCVL